MLLMPIFNASTNKFSYTINLDNAAYFLNYYWNTRDNSWYLTICDGNQNSIVAGRKLVVNYLMLQQWRSYSIPPGDFLVVDLTGQNILPITKTSLGSGIHQLFYISEAEITSGIITGIQ